MPEVEYGYVPDIENPYLDSDSAIEDFRYETNLYIQRNVDAERMSADREADYIVSRPYKVSFTVDGDRHTITVPAGMLTDLVSVPRPFRWLVERVGPHLEAAIVHDFLFIAWQDLDRAPTRADWIYSNRVMVAGMRAANISPWICWVIAWALSTWFSWNRYRDEGRCTRYVDPGAL